jgi:plastocyanin
MKQRTVRAILKSGFLAAAAVCFGAQGLSATTHAVQFGGNVGYSYSPSSFSATVGDTVKWEGDFSVHPLSSTSVPATAQAWQNGSGTSFTYVIKVAGTYNYRCDIHFSSGMVGSFTATASAVRYNALPPGANRAKEILLGVSEVSGMPLVSLTLPRAGQVTIKIFDLSGRERAIALDRVVPAGSYSISLGKATLPSGFYFVELSSNGTQRVASFFMAN